MRAERAGSPVRKQARRSPQGEENDALRLILEEMRKISQRVSDLENVSSPVLPCREGPLETKSLTREEGTDPTCPPSAYVEESEADVLDIHADCLSEDSLYSQREPSPLDSEVGDPLPRGRLEVVLGAAHDIGLLESPSQAPPPSQDVWASGSGTPSQRAHFPVAQGFVEALRKYWPGGSPVGSGARRGCAGMRGVWYAPESGLTWMPSVEREVAMLTSLPFGSVSTDPSHPTADGKAADKLLSMAFNAAMRAARAGNVLAILLAAALRQMGGDNAQLLETLSTALSVQHHVTADVGDCLGQIIRSRRHLWLSETSLPPAVRAQLVALPVEPGRVFHSSTRAALEQAGEARRTKEKICAAFRKPGPRPSASGAQGVQPVWGDEEPPLHPPRAASPPSLPPRGGYGGGSRGRGGLRKGPQRSGGRGKRGPTPQ